MSLPELLYYYPVLGGLKMFSIAYLVSFIAFILPYGKREDCPNVHKLLDMLGY